MFQLQIYGNQGEGGVDSEPASEWYRRSTMCIAYRSGRETENNEYSK